MKCIAILHVWLYVICIGILIFQSYVLTIMDYYVFGIMIRVDEMWRRYNIGNIEIPHLLQVPPLLKDDYI